MSVAVRVNYIVEGRNKTMKRIVGIIIATLAIATLVSGQVSNKKTERDILKFEKDFEHAVVSNDADAIARFVDSGWIIISSDGNIIERLQFLRLVKERTLTHQSMD